MAAQSRKVQIRLDEECYRRLEERAGERGVSIAALIREAIDQAYPEQGLDRRGAADKLLRAEPM